MYLTLHLLPVWWVLSPSGLCVCMLGSQMVALFGKVAEPLGGGTLHEEVGSWRLAFWLYILVLVLIYSLLPIC